MICLLLSLGKLLWKLLIFRLCYFLEWNNILYDKQCGFREGRWCDNSLFAIITSSAMQILSYGILKMFLTMWNDGACCNLRKIVCPSNEIWTIETYLKLHSIHIKGGLRHISALIIKGLPSRFVCGISILVTYYQRSTKIMKMASSYTP